MCVPSTNIKVQINSCFPTSDFLANMILYLFSAFLGLVIFVMSLVDACFLHHLAFHKSASWALEIILECSSYAARLRSEVLTFLSLSIMSPPSSMF